MSSFFLSEQYSVFDENDEPVLLKGKDGKTQISFWRHRDDAEEDAKLIPGGKVTIAPVTLPRAVALVRLARERGVTHVYFTNSKTEMALIPVDEWLGLCTRIVTDMKQEKTEPPAHVPITSGWPRLAAELVEALPEHEQGLIREHEEEMIAGNKMAVDDIINNCHIKPQFAKTYRVLRRDKNQMLQAMRARLMQAIPDSSQAHPDYSDACVMAMIRSTDAILTYKLHLMATHFLRRWHEPIENYAGKEGGLVDKAGCLVVLAILGSGGFGFLWVSCGYLVSVAEGLGRVSR